MHISRLLVDYYISDISELVQALPFSSIQLAKELHYRINKVVIHICVVQKTRNSVLYRDKRKSTENEKKISYSDELVQYSDRSEYTLFCRRTSNTAPFRQKELK